MKQTILRFDAGLTRWVAATFGQRSRPLFEFLTFLGDPLTVTVVTVGLIGSGLYFSNLPLAVSGAIIPATVLVGAMLKILFERARPVTEYAMNMKLQTFSFPSGHSSGSTITYGILAYLVITGLMTPWHLSLGMLLAIIPVGVGISRVYLGAHFPSDVIAGWLLGLISLLATILLIGPQL